MKFAGTISGVVSQNIKKKRERRLESNIVGDTDPNSGDLRVDQIELQMHDTRILKTLTLRSFPIFFWCIGLIFITFGFILLANIIIGPNKPNTIFKGFNEGTWWQIFIILIIFILGISFYVVAKYEKIELNRELNQCTFSKCYLMCCTVKTLMVPLSDIESIYPYKEGNVSTSLNSVIYKVGVRYGEGNKTVHIFKSLFERSVISDVMKLRKFVFNSYDTYDRVKLEIRDGVIYN